MRKVATMTLSERMEGWLAISNHARHQKRDKLANWALRRMGRVLQGRV